MNQYVTGALIKKLRENRRITQLQLAQELGVSDKTISKWETGKGYPDITLVEPLAKALRVSVIELLAGDNVVNKNRACNLLRAKWYVCPVCGNVLHSTGEATVSCCGITLPPLEAEPVDEAHGLHIEHVEDEYYVTVDHSMTKDHFITFLAAVSDDGLQMIKLYPEGNAEARFKTNRTRYIYFYCNHHGLFDRKV
jgi:DNA-binding XRE family transcriptional regulator/desulfoferrodoxin (superoxide reductase-like protein)